MGAWRFTNITQGNAPFWPRLPSISIKNNQPCEIATLDAEVVDPGADQTFEEDDELLVEYAPGDGGSGDTYTAIFAGDLAAPEFKDVGRSDPRIYGLQAQDFTKRLHRNVIDANRKVEETATARILWIMGFSTQGLSTAGVETISDLVDPRDYRGMHVDEALAEVASELGASFYVDFDKVLQFFVTTPTNPAPFDLELPSSPPASYPYRNFSLTRDNIDRVEAVYVQGDGVAVWVGTRGGRETSYSDEGIKTVRRANRVGARILADLATPLRTVRLELDQPGLLPTQTTHLIKPSWSIDEDFVVQSVEISAVDPNDTGGHQLVQATLGDRFTHCYLRSPSAKDNTQENTGDDDSGGTGDVCIDCTRVIVGIDADFTDTLALAFGATLNTVVFDGATLAKYRCDLSHMWTVPRPGSAVELFGHEPGSGTPVLTFPYAVDNNGDIRWNRSSELEGAQAAPMDRPRFWVAGEGEGTAPGMPFAGYGTFDVDHGPASQFIIWRCYVTNNPNSNAFKAEWTAGEVYKGLGSEVNNWVSYGAFLYSDPAWTDPDTPPEDADLPPNSGSSVIGTFLGNGGSGQGIGKTIEVGQPTTGWEAILSGNRVINSTLMPGGRWVVIYATSHKSNGTIGNAGVRTTLTISDNGSGDALGLDCATTPTTGPVLQVRNQLTGALISSVDLDELPDAIRATPNAQHVFLLYSDDSIERYSRDLDLEDTITIAGFGTSLQEWCVDNDFNIYKMTGEVVTRYNRDGDTLGSKDLDAAVGYVYPATAAGAGQLMFVDEQLRVGGSVNNHAALLSVKRSLGSIRVQKFKSDGDATLLAIGRNGQCIVLAGKHDGTTIDDDDMASERWLMRIWATREE